MFRKKRGKKGAGIPTAPKEPKIPQVHRDDAVDGVKYLQTGIKEAREKLKGTDLLEGNIWPVTKEEKQEWQGAAISYLLMTSRIAGTSVQGMDILGLEGVGHMFSLETYFDSEGATIHGETVDGLVKMRLIQGSTSPIADMSDVKINPLGQEIIYIIHVQPLDSLTNQDLFFQLMISSMSILFFGKTYYLLV